MIGVQVNGKHIAIPADMSLVMEQNSNVFQDDQVTSDIVWTFDIPAKPNALVFEQAQYHFVNSIKGYPCVVSFKAVPVAKGTLYIQQSSQESLSCGLTFDGFEEGFIDRLLEENDYGEDIVISETLDGHFDGWRAFLQRSLDPNSVFKFMLFADEQFCRSNGDFGYHENRVSPLEESSSDKLFTKYVNRLFFDENNNIVELSHDKLQGVRIFNYGKPAQGINERKVNGYHFAPALNLHWLVRQVLANSGVRAYGSFFSDKALQKMFVQSFNAMDGNLWQYGPISQHIIINNPAWVGNIAGNYLNFQSDGEEYNSFYQGDNTEFDIRLSLPIGELAQGTVSLEEEPDLPVPVVACQEYKEVYGIMICSRVAAASLRNPTVIARSRRTAGDYVYGFPADRATIVNSMGVSLYTTMQTAFTNIHDGKADYVPMNGGSARLDIMQAADWWFIQLSSSHARESDLVDPVTGCVIDTQITSSYFNTTARFRNNENKIAKLVKCRINTSDSNEAAINVINSTGNFDRRFKAQMDYGDYEILSHFENITDIDISYNDVGLNIYQNIMRWKEHVPHLSNGEFLSAICRMFGLSCYINNLSKEAQLDLFSDTLKAGCIDLTPYVSEAKKLNYQPKQYEILVSPTTSPVSVNEKNVLVPVRKQDELPMAITHKAKSVFVQNENAYRKSARADSKTSKYTWEQGGGNGQKLTLGGKELEKIEVSTTPKVGNMRCVDGSSMVKYVAEINQAGNSALFDEDYSGEFDMVIQQYEGPRVFNMSSVSDSRMSARIESGNPTCYLQSGELHQSRIHLSATGERSLGEIYMKPKFAFLADMVEVEFTAYLPYPVFLQVYRLMKPQQGSPEEQTRFILVNSVKYLPGRISYEFSRSDKVVATITAYRRRIG